MRDEDITSAITDIGTRINIQKAYVLLVLHVKQQNNWDMRDLLKEVEALLVLCQSQGKAEEFLFRGHCQEGC